MNNIYIDPDSKIPPPGEPGEKFKVLDDALLPPVDEFKRFMKIFFKRKIVLFGFTVVVLIILMAIFADFVSPFDPNRQNLGNVLALPGGEHILGTDTLGRDQLSRIIHGSRIALLVGVSTVLISAISGTVIGLLAGYAEGLLSSLLMRSTDALLSIPALIFALILVNVMGGGVLAVVLAVSITLLPGYIRLINGQVLSIKQNDYVLAARTMGANKARIMFRHILPNCLSPLIVQMTMMMGVAIMMEAGLSFLGLGISPPTASWGEMCFAGYRFLLTHPLMSIVPGLAIMLLVFSFNMVGDGLRDALDPKMRGTSTD